MNETAPGPLLGLLPIILMSTIFAVPAYMLAKEKGRNPWKWVILSLIPIVNMVCIWYFIGTPSTRLENKIDAILKAQGQSIDD